MLQQFSHDKLLGMTYIWEHDGRAFHARVKHKVLDQDAQDHQTIKFLLALSDGELEAIIAYNELSDHISEQQQSHIDGHDELLGFHQISDHQGPLKNKDSQLTGFWPG